MNPQLIFDIIALALSLVRGQGANVTATLLRRSSRKAPRLISSTPERLWIHH